LNVIMLGVVVSRRTVHLRVDFRLHRTSRQYRSRSDRRGASNS
jgi:hypothetical protein